MGMLAEWQATLLVVGVWSCGIHKLISGFVGTVFTDTALTDTTSTVTASIVDTRAQHASS
jgi:hypothetical protein